MFKIPKKEDLCQISLTGARALMIISLLVNAPRSLQEIREELTKINLMQEDHSDDILRIDINTLKTMGCEISRSSKKTNYKYVLKKHMFDMPVTSDEISVVKKAYRKLKDKSDINTLVQYDLLFSKIAENVNDNNLKEQIYGISSLKSCNTCLLKSLEDDCKNKRTLKLIYKKPGAKQDVEKTIIAQNILFNNDKFYLCGTDIFSKKAIMLHLKRIKEIVARLTNSDSSIESKSVIVKFVLKQFGVAGLEDNEIVLGKNDDGYLIEGNYYNEFIAIQRILSFGSDCTVIEPQDFRQKIISKLKSMKEVYSG